MSDNNIASGHDFARNLLSAVTNAALYGMQHPQVSRLLSMSFKALSQLLERDDNLSIKVIDDEVVINDLPQPASLSLSRLAALLGSRGIGNLRLLKGITTPELSAFIFALASGSGKDTAITSTEHLRVGRIGVNYRESGNESSSGSAISLPDLSTRDMTCFMEIYESARQKKKLRLTGIGDVVSGFIEACSGGGKSILGLATLREKDEYTFTHSANVAILAIAQAMSLGIEGEQLNAIGVAAMLHDIGKIFIPEEILSKKDKLTDQEFSIMRDHPVLGSRYLLETPGVPRLAVIGAFEHHIKYNKTGYPAVSSSWEINICSHLLMIADMFDAMRTRRSYREPLELADICNLMLNMAGTELHPVLTRNFISIIDKLA